VTGSHGRHWLATDENRFLFAPARTTLLEAGSRPCLVAAHAHKPPPDIRAPVLRCQPLLQPDWWLATAVESGSKHVVCSVPGLQHLSIYIYRGLPPLVA
jgi:hypothetical protein